ncbi:MAG: NAD-dependent deacylase [Anaerolineae bacterium]|nr:NAD-dependent deacylase [Anaerolineae bacterium]
MTDPIQQVVTILKQAQRLAVLTGAGVSKESGVPTFRDALEGLWARYDPQQLATPDAFQRNPKLVWDWYEYRRQMVRMAEPNPGHYALAALESYFPEMVVITQNVDDLHEQAGSSDVIHLHGNIAQSKCFANCQGVPTLIDVAELDTDETPPKCPHCGAYVRPDVVWFGEILPEDALLRAYHISEQADVMLVIGTSGMVTPAANLPEVAQYNGAPVIEVNPDTSMITRIASVKLDGPSGVMLPRLLEALRNDD